MMIAIVILIIDYINY